MSSNTYDLMPYISYPYPQTHIGHVHTVGRLFGLRPADIRRARVLEIGCASGGNLLPMAAQFPDASFLGIDLSENQIALGRQMIAETGLGNIELESLSVLNFPKSRGPFDYIICHGVFSWVSEATQAMILRVISDSLAPDGLAVVSYNVLPGWAMIQSLRHMMIYHGADFANPQEKVAQARALLRFVRDSQAARENNAYYLAVDDELRLLDSNPDWYVFHDHLEPDNKPFYFHEFITQARNAGLDYVGDTNLAQMFLDNNAPAVVETLRAINDPVRLEQYMDFVQNRRFRSSVLCRAGKPVSRNIDSDLVREFHLRSLLTAVSEVDGQTQFATAGGHPSLRTADPVAIAVLRQMAVMTEPATVGDIAQATAKAYGVPAAAAELTLVNTALRLVFAGAMMLQPTPPCSAPAATTSHPQALPLARIQAAHGLVVTNDRHEPVNLAQAPARLLCLLDGTRDVESLAEELAAQIRAGEFKAEVDGAPVPEDKVAQVATDFVTSTLTDFYKYALMRT